MECKALFDRIDELNSEYVKVWEELCNIESPTACKEGVDACSAYLAKIAEKHGWKIERKEMKASGDAFPPGQTGAHPVPPPDWQWPGRERAG